MSRAGLRAGLTCIAAMWCDFLPFARAKSVPRTRSTKKDRGAPLFFSGNSSSWELKTSLRQKLIWKKIKLLFYQLGKPLWPTTCTARIVQKNGPFPTVWGKMRKK